MVSAMLVAPGGANPRPICGSAENVALGNGRPDPLRDASDRSPLATSPHRFPGRVPLGFEGNPARQDIACSSPPPGAEGPAIQAVSAVRTLNPLPLNGLHRRRKMRLCAVLRRALRRESVFDVPVIPVFGIDPMGSRSGSVHGVMHGVRSGANGFKLTGSNPVSGFNLTDRSV